MEQWAAGTAKARGLGGSTAALLRVPPSTAGSLWGPLYPLSLQAKPRGPVAPMSVAEAGCQDRQDGTTCP